LEIEGNPAGTVYLDRGQITFARASWIPDLAARLLGALRLSAAALDLISDSDRPDRDIGTVLVQRNYLSRSDLQAILRSVVVDAALVLMVPTDEDAFVSDIRFAAPGAHWAGAFSSLCVDFVRSEATKRAERVARYNLARTTPIRLCDLRVPSAVVSREQWAVASAIDGAPSVQDLAWHCGLALYDTIECVGHLIQAGACTPCAHPGAATPAESSGPLAQWFGTFASDPSEPDGPPVLSPTAVLPPPPVPPGLARRTPRAAVDTEPPGGGDHLPAQPELLRRVLDGLRKLG
jgi:hypothetical protein